MHKVSADASTSAGDPLSIVTTCASLPQQQNNGYMLVRSEIRNTVDVPLFIHSYCVTDVSTGQTIPLADDPARELVCGRVVHPQQQLFAPLLLSCSLLAVELVVQYEFTDNNNNYNNNKNNNNNISAASDKSPFTMAVSLPLQQHQSPRYYVNMSVVGDKPIMSGKDTESPKCVRIGSFVAFELSISFSQGYHV